MSLKRNTILSTKGEYEFYRNDDGKLVSQLKDKCKDYRRSELLPEVNALLDEYRSYRSGYPTEANINSIIKLQNDHPDKAINYIKYRFFGSASYLDVFGAEAERRYKEQAHIEQNERMEEKVDDLKQQLSDMQQLMINIAKSVNHSSKQVTYRAG